MKFTKSFLTAAFGIAVAMGVAAPTMAQNIEAIMAIKPTIKAMLLPSAV